MTIFTTHPTLRWSAPVAAAVLLGGGGMALHTASAATGAEDLPHRTAEQLLVDVQQARVEGLSGTVVENADLGLPALPVSGGGNGSSKLSSLISGSHTMRVWADGPERIRLSLLGTLGESDVIRNGNDVWLWSSADHSATHLTLPERGGAPRAEHVPTPTPSGPAMTPQQLADHFLSAVKPSTKVTTDNTTTVAGRSAYELVLSPRSKGSLISSVRIAIDGATHVPLRVQVLSTRATKPAFEVGFSSVDFGKPDAAQFRFNPPPGTKVEQQKLSGLTMGQSGMPGGHQSGAKPLAPLKKEIANKQGTSTGSVMSGAGPQIVGSGWTSVVKVPMSSQVLKGLSGSSGSDGSRHGGDSVSAAQFLRNLPHVNGAWGSGRLLKSNVVSALLTDSGTLYVGAVTPQVLYAAAGK
jgi:outer membrane lipoprotein-sorting protein